MPYLPQSTRPPPVNVRHYAYIDSLRGWAILLVVLVHVTFSCVPNLPHALVVLALKGAYGVHLFFMVSALTLFMSYNQRQKREGTLAEPCFFIRRLLRIAPMYYVAAAIFTAVYILAPMDTLEQHFNVRNLVLTLLFLNSFYPYDDCINYVPTGCWSVAIEMAFYLFVPLLFRRITSLRQSIGLFLSAMALSIGLRYLRQAGIVYSEGWYLDLSLPNNFVIFCLGIVLYFLIQRPWRPSALVGGLLYLPVFGAALLVFYVCERTGAPLFLPEHILISMVMGGFVVLLAKRGGMLFVNPIIAHVGKVSFSLYLNHFLLLRLKVLSSIGALPHLAPVVNLLLLYGAVAILGVALSTVTYQLIEMPGIELSRIITRRLLAKRQA